MAKLEFTYTNHIYILNIIYLNVYLYNISKSINSWQIDGETVDTVADFILGGSKITRTSLVAQTVKRLPAMRETWVQSLGREDPLEKEMAIHSSILAWTIPWTEKLSRLQSTGLQRVGHD